MSKPKNIPKQRYEALTMKFSEPVSIDSISWDEHGNVRMYSNGVEMKPLTAHFEKWYEREKNNKVTVCIETKKLNVDMYSYLCDYDYVVALDTNSQGNESFSVGLIYRVYKDSVDETKWYLEYITGVFRIFDNRNNGEGNSSELVALYELIRFFQNGNIIIDFNEKKSLFVVDHNRLFLYDYNSHRKQLLKDKSDSWLPSNVSLMHATSDAPNDSIFNRIISDCDKAANQLKKPDVRKRIFSQINRLSEKDYLIDDSKYTIVVSGSTITDKMPCDVELKYEDANKSLFISIHLVFRKDEGELRTHARFFNMKGFMLCFNFTGLVGLGLVDPLEIGELGGKHHYLKCWVSDADNSSEIKKIDYVIYAEK